MRRFIPNINNTYLKDISGFSDSELLIFYDNPDNFYIKDCRSKEYDDILPDNVILSLTHGSYELPSGFNKQLLGYGNDEKYSKSLRLLKNFSDWGTANIVNSMNLPEEQIVRTLYSRAIGDCNRDIQDISERGFLRKTDFGGLKLFEDTEIFREKGEKHYKDYHNTIEKRLLEIEKQGKKSFLFDIHDTGVRLMDLDIEKDNVDNKLFPLITIANVGGTSCDDKVFRYFAKKIEEHLGIKCLLNEYFKGGYVTKTHGSEYRKILNNFESRNVIQVEVGRFLYMKESTQEIDEEKVRIIGEGLKRAIGDTINKLS